ncbi:hypothetical protein SANTM175S_05561 [Streptomyces antimycoticus]
MLFEGRMVDEAMAATARRTLALAGADDRDGRQGGRGSSASV